MITPEHKKIKQIFNGNFYSIPKYQRAYVWKKAQQISDFWEDLIFQYDQEIKYNNKTTTNLYLGTIILNTSNINNKSLVVDGQQRMTTIFILFVVIRNFLQSIISSPDKNLSSDKLASIRGQLTSIQPFISSSDIAFGTHERATLEASPSIKETIDAMADHEWKPPFNRDLDGFREVSQIYNFFEKMIRQDIDLDHIGSFLKALYDSSCIVIGIEDMEEAYNLFERTNARGQALTVSDLLKNHLFSKGDNENKISEFWDQITEDSGSSLTKMLRYFYVSRQGYIPQNKLYRALKDYGGGNSETLVLEISDFSDYFNLFTSLDSHEKLLSYLKSLNTDPEYNEDFDPDRLYCCYQSINALQHFGMDQPKPLIYSFLKGFYRLRMHHKPQDKSKSKHRKTITHFLQSLENYHFINNVVCQRQTNEVEKLYADYSHKFFTAKTEDIFTAHLYKLYKKLQTQLAKIGEFTENFKEINYSTKRSDILYIFDRLNNTNENGERKPSADWKQTAIFQPHQIGKSSYTIEHWYPQQPKEEKADEVSEMKKVKEMHNIGNLIVLATTTNNKLGNKKPAEKAIYLEDSDMNTLPYNKKFIHDYSSVFENWDDKAILERVAKMAGEAHSLVWRFSPPMLEPTDKSLIEEKE